MLNQEEKRQMWDMRHTTKLWAYFYGIHTQNEVLLKDNRNVSIQNTTDERNVYTKRPLYSTVRMVPR